MSWIQSGLRGVLLMALLGTVITTGWAHASPASSASENMEADELAAEVTARALISGQASPEILSRGLDRLLHLSYRAEFHQRQLEAALDTHESRPVRITEQTAYGELIAIRASRESELHQLEATLSALIRLGDQKILGALGQRVARLTEADRLQLLDFLQAWAETVNSVAVGEKGANFWTGSMEPSESSESSNFGDKFALHEQEIARKARAAANWNDFDLEFARASVRAQSVGGGGADAPANVASDVLAPPRVRPSPDSAGNFIGREMAKGDFVLTFDDGPSATSTPRLLGILSTYQDALHLQGAPATFFVLTTRVRANRSVLQDEQRLGFTIGNHSWDHANFAKLDTAGLTRQIVESGKELKSTLGRDFRFFRCPYGACFAPKIPEARQMIADQGLIHAYWTIDSLDWKNIGHPERTAEFVIKQIQTEGRGVILMHDIHQSSVDATRLILDWVRERNASSDAAKIRLMTLEDAVDKVNAQ